MPDAPRPSHRLTSALGGVLLGAAIAAVGAVFVWLMWASFQRARVMDAWTQVPGVILESRLTEEILNPNTPVNYRPLIRYRYEYAGASRESARIRRIETKSSRRAKMESLLAGFPAGTEAPVWVNPADPADAVLIRDKRTAIYSIWFPALFVIGGLGIALSSLVRNLKPRTNHPMTTRLLVTLATTLGLLTASPTRAAETNTHDIVIYGGTSAGVTAAIQAARLGKSVALIEPTRHLGGLSSAGLGMTDSGKHEVIGGLAREFYRRIKKHYEADSAWKWEKRDDFKWWSETGDALWRFEPSVAETTFRAMLARTPVTVVEGERLDLTRWGRKSGTAITEIRMESGRVFQGKIFIDATYEGDLMAKAGVPYHVGREANATYGETLNGVQVAQATKHQFLLDIDPWRVPGDPSSGLLPTIQTDGPGTDGAGDHRIQAYCFRICLTDVPANRLPWEKPTNYDPLRYEVLRRYLAAGWKWKEMWRGHHLMPNRKTDTNNSGGFSSDHIGANYAYPEGGYATREAIVKDHEEYQKGFWYFLATDPGVPAEVREDVNRWGLPRDEFQATGGWPHALYIREARRMISDHIHTQMDCQLTRETPQPVGMGSYAIDSHNTQRYVDTRGFVRNEGDVQVPLAAPYPISYLSIRPRAADCTNLLVPVCCAASHIGYGSVRMEPVFMILGESAATAASLALDAGTSVQDVPYPALRQRLLENGQVLEWNKPPAKH